MPGQSGHLTPYGDLGHLVSSTNPAPNPRDAMTQEAAHLGVNTQLIKKPVSIDIQRNPSALNTMTNNASDLVGFSNSPPSSDAEIHPSAGASLEKLDGTADRKMQHQTSTFPQLAKLEGIREWNNSVWDDRWLLKPEEMWNIDGRRQSVLTVSPERQPSGHNNMRTGDASKYSDQSSKPPNEMDLRIERLGRDLEATKLALGYRQGDSKTNGDSSGSQQDLMSKY